MTFYFLGGSLKFEQLNIKNFETVSSNPNLYLIQRILDIYEYSGILTFIELLSVVRICQHQRLD